MSEWRRQLRTVRELAVRMRCDCYATTEMEFDPAGPCPRCQLVDAIDKLLGTETE